MQEVNAGNVFVSMGNLKGGELKSYILMPVDSFDIVFQSLNLKIMEAAAKGGECSFTDLLKSSGIPRGGQLARHLKALIKANWLIHTGGKCYEPAAALFVAFNADYSDGEIKLRLRNDRGAFMDPQYGILIFKGSTGLCKTCPFREACVKNVKNLSKAYDIVIRSVEPSDAYVEIFNALISRDLIKRLKTQSLIPATGAIRSS